MSNLFSTILTYFDCISDCPWLYLAGDEGAKSTDSNAYIMAADIRNTCTRNICIGSTYAVGT